MIDPQTFYKQAALILKPFYKFQGAEFLEKLENDLKNLGLDNHGETVRLARQHLEGEEPY